MTAIKEKEFRFQGLDLKTEIRLGFALLPILVVVLLGLFYLLNVFLPVNPLQVPRGLIIPAILGISILSMYWLAKLVRDKTWTVRVNAERLLIRFRKQEFDIPLESIREINNMGSADFRYLTFYTKTGLSVRMRVGIGAMTPFSRKEDLQTVDEMMSCLKPYIDKHFNKKDLRNKIHQNLFPHYGVYLVKTEPLTYKWLEKRTPGQVMLIFLGAGVIILVLLLQVLFYYIDHKS
ncbi:hypothetical protein SAMN04488128_102118 [Chitinophaga eiseniae]|uniref:Uncharacterized protein n=2 Tax=Chitinophaga eiseniae TaxID=634771 RepID=A0A1T4Q236_9BACT|nr:hypothetical protein SAMN04488128_102118 [Chitinophaga eiseniae]